MRDTAPADTIQHSIAVILMNNVMILTMIALNRLFGIRSEAIARVNLDAHPANETLRLPLTA